jgi:glycosyltransferase involved in cell wall biosynthesis
MRIALDARPLRVREGSGLTVFLSSVLQALGEIDRDHEYLLYAHADFEWAAPQGMRVSKRTSGGVYGTVWMQSVVPRWLREGGVDLFWGTQHTLPLGMPGGMPAVLSFHDVAHARIPETMRRSSYWVNRTLIPPSVRRADVLVALSETTAGELRELLDVPPERIRVALPGVAADFWPIEPAEARRALAAHLPGPEPYVLAVGALEPKKNLVTSLRAWARIAHRWPHRLVVAGPPGWRVQEALDLLETPALHGKVQRLGYVPRPLLPALYAGADVFVFPSIYEGFGMPVVEAMACGTAVVTSNVSSLPEAAGGAALLVDPRDDAALAEAIEAVLTDAARRADLVRRGLERAARLRWSDTARHYLDIFAGLR